MWIEEPWFDYERCDVVGSTVVLYDEDIDDRLIEFVCIVGSKSLAYAYETHGTLYLAWDNDIPDEYMPGNTVAVGDDSWIIAESVKLPIWIN